MQFSRRHQERLQQIHTANPRRRQARNIGLPIFTKAKSAPVLARGESTDTHTRRSDRLNGKQINYNQDSDEDELAQKLRDQSIEPQINQYHKTTAESPEPSIDGSEKDNDLALSG